MEAKFKPKIIKKQVMRRKEKDKLLQDSSKFIDRKKIKTVEQAKLNGIIIYVLNGSIQLAKKEDVLFPTLTNTIIDNLPSIIVDMGAVPYVCDGANIMAPGILRINGNFSKNEIVVIRDTNFKKALAVGKGLVSSDDMNKIKKGKVIQNLHYVGDKIWRLL